MEAVAAAIAAGDRRAAAQVRLELHGAALGPDGIQRLAGDVLTTASDAATAAVAGWHVTNPAEAGMPLPALRTVVERAVRRLATLASETGPSTADVVIAAVVRDGRLLREGDRLRRPEPRVAGPDPVLTAAMERLEAALAGNAPPPLGATAASVRCPAEGIRALEKAGRIVVLEPDLAWAASSYRELAARALVMAHRGPLTPAAYRDATGTSRKYSLAILEDLDRRGILRRTDAGHLPGPKAPPLPGRPDNGG